MKKLLSLILAGVMLIIPLGALADSSTSSELEKVLIAVKTKINVPSDLTEFSSYVSERSEKTYYNLDWSNEDYSKTLSASCDSEGRIISYHNYINDSTDKKFSSFSKDEIVDFAAKFIQKTLPETNRGEGDILVYDESSYDARGNMRYSMRFDRRKESVRVKDNYADVTVCETDGALSVRSLNVSYDYDTEFVLSAETEDGYIEKYKAAFPAELIYRDEYNYYAPKGMPKNTPVLVYRIKDDNIGYIDAVTGEVVTEDEVENELFKAESSVMEDSSAGGGANRNDILTPQEIEELERIEGLLSISDIEKAVKKLPYVDFASDMVLTSSDLSKYEEDYTYRLYYSSEKEDDYRYIRINADAKTGKILSLYTKSGYSEEEFTEAQIKDTENKITEFLNAVAREELGECEEQEKNGYKKTLNKHYMRIVNGVKYINNGINVSFDAENNCITNYSLNFTKADFQNPENAIGEVAAYGKILEYAPVVPLYIRSGGAYKRVFTLDCYGIQIDAITGDIMDGYSEEGANYTYSDIDGHWAEEAAEKLSEIQVGFSGGMLEPEKEVTQKDFLRLAASGIYDKYYAGYTEADLYRYLINDGILTEEEKAPDSFVTREQAFVYIIRFADLEKVAELSDIYRVSYVDGHLLSEGKIGYAAILSGLGVVCGNGGELRPQSKLTRAEAIVMLYRYLLKI